MFILYRAYSDYNELLNSANYIGNGYEHKVMMVVSSIVLILSLIIIYRERDYFFLKVEDNREALEQLLEDIKVSLDANKIRKFKELLNQNKHTEIYPLISSMINELHESKKMADDANRTKSLFLSNMSNEIRTPLNGIIGFTKLLKSTKLDDEQLDFVDTIRKSSEDLLDIINDILDMSKIESGKIEIEKSYFNVFNEFENIIETYSRVALKKSIDLSIWIDPELSSQNLESDAGKIRQVLRNLISNAIKFTPEGGEIDVSIKEIDSNGDDSVTVEFSVEDSGIGISQEDKDRVFDAFTQVDSDSIKEHGGTGLGLTIATSLVRMLGGFLELDSKVDVGSKFSFRLNMKQRFITREINYQTMKVAIYSPPLVQNKKSDSYLEKYLQSFRDIDVNRFEDFVECQDAQPNSFDGLFVHYNDIDKKELKRIAARHSLDSQIVLVTQLKNRDDILDIAPIFSQIIYEPIGFTKIEKSIETLSENKKDHDDNISNMFHGLKALVVEDNPVNSKMILRTLEKLGIESDTAKDGQESVNMYMKSRYNIIFMDIQMPVMNGVDATRAIIKYEKKNHLTHTPIVAVTTNALKGDRERYLSEGMDEYIAKPIDLNKFITVLKQFYSTKQLENISLKSEVKDILLYKQTPTESKIIGTILKKLGFSVDIAKNIDEFQNMMDTSRYKALLLDKLDNQTRHINITESIKRQETPSLLFVDKDDDIMSIEKETYSYIIDKASDFIYIKDKIDNMMSI
jgi:signal transduction histidine kinase/DNA-binding response OmpR family regulator